MTSLREEQRRLARDRIMHAVAAEIVERGLMDLALPAVAERAGVSLRTVYNYFESKDALVAALPEWVVETMAARGAPPPSADLGEIPGAIRANFRVFSELGTLTEAVVRVRQAGGVGGGAGPHSSRHRTARLRAAVEDRWSMLDAPAVDAVTAVLRIPMSFDTWRRLTGDHGLDGTVAGEMAAWMFERCVAGIDAGEEPWLHAEAPGR